ncbi:hypothetical protein [Yersinia similis]|uniref:hypothetical protein n=1 Tax=Yersinia similis TaxID=367190 RepID=UPI0038502A13
MNGKLTVFFLILVSLFIYLWWLFIMPNTTYNDKNILKYYALTYKEVINAPRLSDNYYFEYIPSDETSPQSSIMYTCGLKNIDEGYKNLVSYIIKTGIPLRKEYLLDDFPYSEYFELIKVTIKGDECLMLVLSK